MTVKTYKAEEARTKMRDILDDVMMGHAEAVIERNGKRTAVVIGYAQWETYKRYEKERLDQARQAYQVGEYVTWEDALTELRKSDLL